MSELPDRIEAAAALLDRKRSRERLLDFAKFTKPDFKVGPHHRLIAEKLELVEQGIIDRLIISAPPRHGKSELTSKRFAAWYLGRHPDHQIIAASYNAELASFFGRDVRNIFQEPSFQLLFPDVQLAPDSKAAQRWNIKTHGGAYVAAGVGGGITGFGAHVLLIDDPIKDRTEADSLKRRDEIWHWYTNVAYTRLMPGGKVVVIMTRWHDDDISGRLIKSQNEGGDKWEVLRLPAIAEENDDLGREPGEALWPEWYDREALDRIKSSLTVLDGPRAWVALYQGKPHEDSGSYFLKEWFKYYTPGDEPPLTMYAASDYAVSTGGDFTVHLIGGVDENHNFYVTDIYREQAGPKEWIEAQIQMLEDHRIVEWAEEAGQIDKSIGPFRDKLLREQGVYGTFEPYSSTVNKAARAQSIRGRFSMGKVFFPRHRDWTGDMEAELLAFSGQGDEVDDTVDAFSLIGRMLNKMYGISLPRENQPRSFNRGDILIREMTSRQKAMPKYG